MPEPYFQGPECEWLRGQVAAILWEPHANGQALAPASATRVVKTPTAPRQPSQAQVKASMMSVEEYNAWRGTDPRLAAAHPYVFQKYPTILYRNGERRKITNAHDHDLHLSQGWKETP